MTVPETTELRLSASPREAVAAIRKALPDDAIVRGEDDAIGRFAAERMVMIVGHGERRLMLFRGTWRVVKARENDPHLNVELVDVDGGLAVRLRRGRTEQPGAIKRALEVVGNMVTVALLVVAYHWFRKDPVDYGLVAGIGVGGGLLWSAVAFLWPRREEVGLEDMVRKAVAPLAANEQPATTRM